MVQAPPRLGPNLSPFVLSSVIITLPIDQELDLERCSQGQDSR